MNLKTTYLGLNLKNPVIASASPLSRKLEGIRLLEDAGVSAIVLPSLFEEEIEQEIKYLDHFLDFGSESNPEAIDFIPEPDRTPALRDEYLKTIVAAKEATDVPIIASLNGATAGGWILNADKIQQAGADALELNIYYMPTNADQPAHRIETQYLQAIQVALSCVTIPVAVKIGPYFSSLPHFAREVQKAGARGLVMFNRFYQPEINLDTLEIEPNLTLSRSEDLRLPLRWTAILSSQLDIDIAITGGVHTATDVVKSMMSGAKATMLASELLHNGIGRVGEILNDLALWMEEREYESIQQMHGSMTLTNVGDPSAYERANYMKVLHSFRSEAMANLVP